MTNSDCPILGRIEQLWPNLSRSAQRSLCNDVDLCREDRDNADIYNLTSKTRLSPVGELNRIRAAWPKIDGEKRKQLANQAECAYRGKK